MFKKLQQSKRYNKSNAYLAEIKTPEHVHERADVEFAALCALLCVLCVRDNK